MERCPKCKAKVGIMTETVTANTGAVHCIKCYICGFWLHTGSWQAPPQLRFAQDAPLAS